MTEKSPLPGGTAPAAPAVPKQRPTPTQRDLDCRYGARPFDRHEFELARSRWGCEWGDLLHYLAECSSTNDEALMAARRGERHGALFVSDYQHGGRGQHGRSWLAPPNQALLFSLLLRPGAQLALDASLTLAVGLAVRATLATFVEEPERVQIKWPNDVWIDGQKVCGILCEAQASGGKLQAVVVGVGLNVSTTNFPAELASQATSLFLSGAHVPSRESLLAQLLAQCERRVQRGPRGAEELTRELNAHDALRDRCVRVAMTQGEAAGVARGIDSQGRLLLESAGGLSPVVAGTVHLLDE